MPLVPAITHQNARELQRLSVEARNRNKMAYRLSLQSDAVPEQTQLSAVILRQIEDIDRDWRDAKPVDKPRLAQAKAQLWALLFPKPKPARGRSIRPIPVATEAPAAPQAPASSMPAASVVQPKPEPPKQAE